MAQITRERVETVEARTEARGGRWPWGWLACVGVLAGLGAYHWLVYTPRPDIPHRLAILDMLFRFGVAGAMVFLGLLVGLRILRPLRLSTYLSRIELVALSAGLGLGVLSVFTLGLGLLHLYYTPTFVALLTVGPLLFPAERRWLSVSVRNGWATTRSLARRRSISVESAICLPFGAVSVAGLLLCYARDLTPPAGGVGYDTYQYHWAIPSLLLRAHTWQGFAGWAHANLPFNTEMLNLIALSLRAPTSASMVQDTFGALCAMLLFGLLRRHFGPVVGWLAVASLVSVPLFMAYVSQSYVETALLFYGVASLSLVTCWLTHRLETSRAGIEALGLAGAALGFAIGVKYTAIEYVPGLLILLVAGVVALVRRARVSGAAPANARGIAWLALAFALGVCLTIAPWFVKNMIYLGNPVYPALGSIFPDPLWNTTRDQTLTATFQHFGPHQGVVARFHLYAFDLFMHPERYREGETLQTGLVPWAAALAVPTLVVGWWRGWFSGDERRRGQMLVMAGMAAVTFCGLMVWTASGALVERYAIPPVVLAAALGATIMGWLATELARWASGRHIVTIGRVTQAVSLAVLAATLLLCVQTERAYVYRDMTRARNPLPLANGSISEDQYRDGRIGGAMSGDFWTMVDYVNLRLPHDGKLLMLARGTGYFFTDRDYVADSGGDWVPYLVSEGKTPLGILDLLHAQGYTYVVYDASLMRWLEYVYQNRVLLDDTPAYLAFQQTYLIPVASWGDFSLYRVP